MTAHTTMLIAAGLLSLAACNGEPTATPDAGPGSAPHATPDKAPTAPPPAEGVPDAGEIAKKANAFFKPLPAYMGTDANATANDSLVALGRALYYETRLSKNHDISCNSCHLLDKYGVDGEPTSPGHKGVRGTRNSPTTYNAAMHSTQFWDGRSPDVEDQSKSPVHNPVEIAITDEATVLKVLGSIPGYVDMFKANFPDAAAL